MEDSTASKLKELLLASMPLASPASGGTHVVFRCPFCGDSHNMRSKHFYVKVGLDGSHPVYYCQKCKTSGLLTTPILNSWGIYDIDLNVNLSKSYKNRKIIRSNYAKNNYSLTNNYTADNELSKVKLDYINKRIGTQLNYKDLQDLKIVLNLLDVLNSNNIQNYTRYPNIMRELDSSFLGFISSDNAYINLKNLRRGKVSPYIDKKYLDYNIFGSEDSDHKFYIIPNTIYPHTNERIKINIAEGSFDILSIYLNLKNKEPQNIYASVWGSNYISVLKYLLIEMKFFYSEIHIYRDNDIDISEFYEIANFLKIYNIPLYIHTNLIGKDFGVSIDKIKEDIRRI